MHLQFTLFHLGAAGTLGKTTEEPDDIPQLSLLIKQNSYIHTWALSALEQGEALARQALRTLAAEQSPQAQWFCWTWLTGHQTEN